MAQETRELTPLETVLIMEALEAYWQHPRCIKGDFKLLREKIQRWVIEEIDEKYSPSH